MKRVLLMLCVLFARNMVAPAATEVVVFCNNVLSGNKGELVRFDAPNDQLWLATSVWAEGHAKPGAQPAGVKVERLESPSAERVAEFKADIAPILAAMMCPRSFDEAFPVRMQITVLEPREVGPVWMRGDPWQVPRIGERKPVPDLPKKEPPKKTR